jgi:hypothetical protein
LFPALYKLGVLDSTSVLEKTVRDAETAFQEEIHKLDDLLVQALKDESELASTPRTKGVNVNIPPDHKSQAIMDAVYASDKAERRLLVGLDVLNGRILLEKSRIERIFITLSRTMAHKAASIKRVRNIYQNVHNLRLLGSIPNIGYPLPKHLVGVFLSEQQDNSRIIIPKETKKEVLDYILLKFKDDKDQFIELTGEKMKWFNIITQWLREDIDNGDTCMRDNTDWRRVYNYYEARDALHEFSQCPTLKLQLDDRWCHTETIHADHNRLVSENLQAQANQEQQMEALKAREAEQATKKATVSAASKKK